MMYMTRVLYKLTKGFSYRLSGNLTNCDSTPPKIFNGNRLLWVGHAGGVLYDIQSFNEVFVAKHEDLSCTFNITIINFKIDEVDPEGEKLDDHTGMVYNPVDGDWKWF